MLWMVWSCKDIRFGPCCVIGRVIISINSLSSFDSLSQEKVKFNKMKYTDQKLFLTKMKKRKTPLNLKG